jgi:hypothetical protein
VPSGQIRQSRDGSPRRGPGGQRALRRARSRQRVSWACALRGRGQGRRGGGDARCERAFVCAQTRVLSRLFRRPSLSL